MSAADAMRPRGRRPADQTLRSAQMVMRDLDDIVHQQERLLQRADAVCTYVAERGDLSDRWRAELLDIGLEIRQYLRPPAAPDEPAQQIQQPMGRTTQ